MTVRTLLAVAVIVATPSLALANHATTAQEGYKEANDKMMQDMMKPLSGDPDKDFAMMMIPHHQGAIDMAKVELEHGDDPQLRAMAQAIIDAQEKESAEFKEWLQKHP